MKKKGYSKQTIILEIFTNGKQFKNGV